MVVELDAGMVVELVVSGLVAGMVFKLVAVMIA
jgi:tetrahydromethanopterin S-methyltransferase subunit F